MQRLYIRALLRIFVGRYEQYGLQHPDHKVFEPHPTINSELLYYLKHGRITPHPDIKRYDGQEVEFVDGRREAFDLIVCATGYNLSLPLLAPGVVEWKNGIPQLLGMVTPNWSSSSRSPCIGKMAKPLVSINSNSEPETVESGGS